MNRDWAEFQRRLADYLAAMQDEDLLVLESGFEELDESQGLMPCIQFVVWTGTRCAARCRRTITCTPTAH